MLYSGEMSHTKKTIPCPRHIVLISTLLLLLAPSFALTQADDGSYEQEFVLTAYYSPLPDQCCYVKGSEIADKILNGQGIRGADGTGVYAGMLAAPSSYAFGTRIVLPGLGVLTVHDRGGAIQEWDNAHRLDVWTGYGEEGLARALAFGVKRIRGRVHPNGTVQPAERFSLDTLPAPLEELRPFVASENGLLDMRPTFGSRGLSVQMLQDHLKQTGYFTEAVTTMYGEKTKQALATFIADMQLDESAEALTEKTAAYLVAAVQLKDATAPVTFVSPESSATDIRKAQRLLRSFGYYRGRTDGLYSDRLFESILRFQQDESLVGTKDAPGAGRIGPLTKSKIVQQWKQRRIAVRAEKYLALREIRQILSQRGELVSTFMEQGNNGKSVRAIQEMLAAGGFFPADEINGHFGPLTETSLTNYQIARGIIKTAHDKGAGTIGPVTLRTLRQEQIRHTYTVVRSEGWEAL